MKKLKTLISFSLFICFSSQAQNNFTHSPYSYYGLGTQTQQSTGFNRGMAGLGYAMRNEMQLNTKNPAAISAIGKNSFLYDMGGSFQYAYLSNDKASANRFNGSVDYLVAGFRLTNNLGIYFNFQPFSAIGYNIVQKGVSTTYPPVGELTFTQRLKGEGGFKEGGFGIGWQPVKNFSLGISGAYFWGNYKHTIFNTYNTKNIDPTNELYSLNLSSYQLGTGLQYVFALSKKQSVSVGATYRMGHQLGATASYFSQQIKDGRSLTTDSATLSNALTLPHTFGGGVVWQYNNKVRIGADYTLALWKDLKAPIVENGKYILSDGAFTNRETFTLGGEYYRNPEGLRYHDHLIYTLGASFTKDYVKLKGMGSNQSFLLTAGISLPISNIYNTQNRVNIALEWEHIKPQIKTFIQENYLRLSVGITFNERWFMKYKVD